MDGNKLTSHVAYDSISYSLDSLSFSGLISSIQDHQPKSPSPNRAKRYLLSKHDPEFEFASTKANLNFAVSPIKVTPADQLISNGQLRPQALAIQTNETLITNPSSSSSSLLATHSSSKMSSGSNMKYHEHHNKANKHTNKKSSQTGTRFGRKMKSLLSPCREC